MVCLINVLSAGQLGAGDVLQGLEVRDGAVARNKSDEDEAEKCSYIFGVQ